VSFSACSLALTTSFTSTFPVAWLHFIL